MVNASIRSSTFPTEWKTATVTPLIKKPDSDPEDMKNFRPVSNLSYISKLTEKIVMKQIDQHLDNNNLQEPLQSAYRSNHSTETALVKIVNDLRSEVDNKKCVLLVLLDMSAAFDTVEQSTLLKRFETDFGIEGSVNQWLRSYFTGRSQRVSIQGTLSEPKGMKCGMPQGSIIGPKGYPPYVSPIFAIARASEISVHMYADDTQLYVSFSPEDFPAAQAKMERCIAQIRQWLSQNCLKLNDGKTELMVIGQPAQLKKITSDINITIGDSVISGSSSVRNIGAVLDSGLSMDEQIKNICRSCNISLRSLSKIRSCLTEDSATTLTHAFITCKLDNLNSLLTGPYMDTKLNRLQLIQNHAARVITRTKKFEHISGVLKKLHWLPIKARIDYKVLLFVFKCLVGIGPSYLKELLSMKTYSPYNTRYSKDKLRLSEPEMNMKTMGDRAFRAYGPVQWNKLPLSLRSLSNVEIKDSKTIKRQVETLKKDLKTHLFKQKQYFKSEK